MTFPSGQQRTLFLSQLHFSSGSSQGWRWGAGRWGVGWGGGDGCFSSQWLQVDDRQPEPKMPPCFPPDCYARYSLERSWSLPSKQAWAILDPPTYCARPQSWSPPCWAMFSITAQLRGGKSQGHWLPCSGGTVASRALPGKPWGNGRDNSYIYIKAMMGWAAALWCSA